MAGRCQGCGLNEWDTDDLTPGEQVCVCDDDEWSDPLPDGVRHAMATVDDQLVCCGQNPHTLPAGDWMTSDPQRITCTGVAS